MCVLRMLGKYYQKKSSKAYSGLGEGPATLFTQDEKVGIYCYTLRGIGTGSFILSRISSI